MAAMMTRFGKPAGQSVRDGRALKFVVAALLPTFLPMPCTAATDVDDALRAMAQEVAFVRKACAEPVKVTANTVALSDNVSGVHIVLTSPICLGEFGRYDYLMVRDVDGRWQTVLGGGPGLITFKPTQGSRFARIEIAAVMGCSLKFTWDGSVYVRHGSPECAGGSKGVEWRILERIMRASVRSPS